jgi:radical SAM protein with 4Fe4S-binding SPASM domain
MAMADLKSAGQLAIGVFVATRINLSTWTKTIELAVALGLDGLLFNRFNPGGRGLKNLERLQADPKEIQDALDVGEDLSSAYEIPISCSVVMPPCVLDIHRYKRLTFGFCAAGTERGYPTLDPQGNLRPCNHSPTRLGSARETGFWELMEGSLMREFVAARPASCSGCDHEMTCLGGCKASAEACTGSYWEIDPFVKAYRRPERG